MNNAKFKKMAAATLAAARETDTLVLAIKTVNGFSMVQTSCDRCADLVHIARSLLEDAMTRVNDPAGARLMEAVTAALRVLPEEYD